MLAVAFVAFVVHAAAANQCPASALGACARLHQQFMHGREVVPTTLVAEPMRAATERG
jgi:hypothetical protein